MCQLRSQRCWQDVLQIPGKCELKWDRFLIYCRALLVWEMLIFTWCGMKVYRELICNCFMSVRGEALTFVYAFPPLSSCRENRKTVMNPVIWADPTLYYRGLQLQGSLQESWNYRLGPHSWFLRAWHHGGVHMGDSALKYPGDISVRTSPNHIEQLLFSLVNQVCKQIQFCRTGHQYWGCPLLVDLLTNWSFWS